MGDKRKMTKDEMKNRISFALKDPILQQGFEIICKENAELKAKNKWYSEQVCNKECAEVWGQLTKAEEIIKEILEEDNYALMLPKEMRLRAEQFLNSEVEK